MGATYISFNGHERNGMKTTLISHADCLKHSVPPGHPECVDRLTCINDALASLDVIRESAPLATDDLLFLAHSPDHIADLSALSPSSGPIGVDADTWMAVGTLDAARRSAGACAYGVDLLIAGAASNVFVATRPPGHHAEKHKAMGFCFFGNAAVAAKHALDNHHLDRVAIVDFDVHHGNGTQDILWNEPRSLVITSQQMPLWPGTGHPSETGTSNNILNIPLPPKSDGRRMRQDYEEKVFPRLRDFRPQLIILSAGFDAHAQDPLADLNWTEEDYGWLTANIMALADDLCGGRVLSTLEGGYDLSALSESVRIHVEELMRAN